MARNYSLRGFCTAGANKTAVELVTTAAIRIKIYGLLVSCPAAPAAQAALWALQRHTGTGTGTALVPAKIDPADPASLCGGKINMSAEGTYTADDVPWEEGINQQASWAEKFNPGREVVLAASATAGVGLRTVTSTGTAVHNASIMWEE